MRLSQENILVVGDRDRRMQTAVAGAMPTAAVTAVLSVFDAIAELHAGMFSGVLVNTDPLEARPEAAARALRDAAGDGRIVLWSDAAREPLSRRLVEHGVDDYVITPPLPSELQRSLGNENANQNAKPSAGRSPPASPGDSSDVATSILPLQNLPLTEILLDAMVDHPQRAVERAIESINHRLAPLMALTFHAASDHVAVAGPDRVAVTHPLRSADGQPAGVLVLEMPHPIDEPAAHTALGHIAAVLAKVHQIDDRQTRLQKLAITDDLTGVYNVRYFRHFLARMLEKARQLRFPVTLLLFDIDNFKKYNDQFGHGVGDEILKQTAALMKRCTRDHDLVARISGDEFAVIFWEKDGPRQPKDQSHPARLPSTPVQIAGRFRKLLGNKDFSEFSMLGTAGKGILTVSGGMAVYPYDARTPEELIAAADRAMMFGAKKNGKNSIFLVGDEEAAHTDEPPGNEAGEPNHPE